MKENMLPKKTLFLWQLRFLIITVVLIAVCTFLFFASVWFFIFVPFLVVISLIFMFWYLPCYFNSYEILFDKGVIIINRGVFIKTSHIMPFSRMVYAQSFSTPIAKMLSLSAIILKAARSNLLIPEMEKSDVEEFILAISKEDEC